MYESLEREITLLGLRYVLSGSVVSSQFLNVSLSLSLFEQLNHFLSSHLGLGICPKGNHNPMLVNIPPFPPCSVASHHLLNSSDVKLLTETSRFRADPDIT